MAALSTLTCLKTMPFQVGKSGLAKVLAGSITASVKGDRAPQFGALEGLSQGKISGLIDRLIEDGFIHRDETSEYRLLSLTAAGHKVLRSVKSKRTAWLAARLRHLEPEQLEAIDVAIEPLAHLLELDTESA